MKIVIDSNRVFAALIKDGTTRKILFDRTFEFIAPDYIMLEIREHENYEKFIEEIKYEIKDPEDLPYFAVSIAEKTDGIWMHDPHFTEQHKIRIFTNIDMLRFSGNAHLN